jgi:hypothetical protein
MPENNTFGRDLVILHLNITQSKHNADYFICGVHNRECSGWMACKEYV